MDYDNILLWYIIVLFIIVHNKITVFN
jgi:hypothetical protein